MILAIPAMESISNPPREELNNPLRRSERIRSKPKHLEDYAVLALNVEAFLDDVPKTFEEIESRDDKEKWNQAIQEEIIALESNNTWELVKLPVGKRPIDSKWIFKIKPDNEGRQEHYKARLVIKGCSQRKGFDYEEIYAPVARLTTIRTLLAIILEEDLFAYQMDVKNAFLHGTLKIYMKIPSGYKCRQDFVCKLRKTLYGLRQAPRAWNETFDNFVRSLGLKNSETDKCLYVNKSDIYKLYLLLYVDDIIIAGNDMKKILDLKSALSNKFLMKDLGKLQSFLGINIKRTSNALHMSQATYAQKLLKRFGMEECKPVKTSMEIKPPKNVDAEVIDETKPYRELVGCLMYLMLTTRPDLSTAVNHFSRFQSNTTEAHWKGLKRILRYIQGC